MAQRDDELQWIIARLSGNISQEEEQQLREWTRKSDSNQRVYDEAVKIWESSRIKLVHRNPATEQEWEKLKVLILKRRNFIQTVDTRVWLSAAACFFILVFLGFYFYNRSSGEEQSQPTMLTINTSNEVKTIYLPDSSKVWLNVNSELSYAEDFGKFSRAVNLKGEAYFIVQKDTARPFHVLMQDVSIVVTGTSFNVNTSDTIVNVIVEEGTVNLSDNGTSQFVSLTQGEKGIRSGSFLTETKNTDPLFASWRKKNNPTYNEEANNPLHFLQQKYDGEKNQFNQSVITGSIRNTATLATFRNITIKVSYKKPNGKQVVSHFDLTDPVHPGKTLLYRKRLLDIFTKKPVITVEIEKAEVVK